MIRTVAILALSLLWSGVVLCQKNPWLPAKNGRSIYFEEQNWKDEFITKRTCLGKSKSHNKRTLYLHDRGDQENAFRDTAQYDIDKLNVRIHAPYTLLGLTAHKKVLHIPNEGKLVLVDTIEFDMAVYRVVSIYENQDFVTVGSIRFNDIMYTKIEVIPIGGMISEEEKGKVLETTNYFFAKDIGLVAKLEFDLDENLMYSFVAVHPEKGRWITYNKKGNISSREKYKKGERHGKYKYYHQSGYLMDKNKYVLGDLDGEQYRYYESGKVKRVRLYDAGIRKKVTNWYENGQMLSEGSYKDEKRHGVWRKWNDTGKLIAEAEYEHGKVVDGAWPME